jgi:RIO kinase 2
MSEYNIFVDTDGITLFDWPQAVPTEHENSDDLLTRDVENIVGYFGRKYPHEVPDVDTDEIASAITESAFEAVADYETA